MTTPYTTDEKGFIPLVAKAMAAKRIEMAPVDPKIFKTDANFVLSPKSALSLQQMAMTYAGKPFKDLRELRLPYDKITVELPLTPEIRALRNSVAGPSVTAVRRIAARITYRQHDDGAVSVNFWPYWEFDDGTLGGGLVSVNLTTGMNVPPPLVLGHDAGTDTTASYIPGPLTIARLQPEGKTDEALVEAFAATMRAHPNAIPEVTEELSPLLFVWEALVHCKSGLTRTPVGPKGGTAAKLGKRRRIMANTEYTVLSLTATETISKGVTSTRADVDAHLVRGHFKRRKSGVYWWSPFVRGTGELRERKGYIVEGVPA